VRHFGHVPTTGFRGCHSYPHLTQMSGMGNRTFFVMCKSYSSASVNVKGPHERHSEGW
jgi:hypothetical protein